MMGYVNALGMAEYAELRPGIEYQLMVNHFPPPPSFMVDVAVAAVEAFNNGDPGYRIELPNGTTFRGRRFATAAEVVESFHLEPWLDDDGDEFDDADAMCQYYNIHPR